MSDSNKPYFCVIDQPAAQPKKCENEKCQIESKNELCAIIHEICQCKQYEDQCEECGIKLERVGPYKDKSIRKHKDCANEYFCYICKKYVRSSSFAPFDIEHDCMVPTVRKTKVN